MVQRQSNSAGAAPPNKPPPPVKPAQLPKPVNIGQSDSSFQEETQPAYANEDQSTSDTPHTYANEGQPKKALVPKVWTPSIKFQPQSPNSESTSISFQDGNDTQGNHDNTSRVPVKPLKPPVQATKPSLGGAKKPPVPETKPPINRTPSNPGAKPKIAPKPNANVSSC